MKYNPTVNSRSQKMYYFILCGPLALCNASKEDVTTSFYCFDVMGDLLLWEARFSQREECNHQNDGGLTRFRSAVISRCLMVDHLLMMGINCTGLVLRTCMPYVVPFSRAIIKRRWTCSWRSYYMTAMLKSFTRMSSFPAKIFFWTTIWQTSWFKLDWTCRSWRCYVRA